jgi:hypothetical protein
MLFSELLLPCSKLVKKYLGLQTVSPKKLKESFFSLQLRSKKMGQPLCGAVFKKIFCET